MYEAQKIFFLNCGVMQRFYFSDGSPWSRILPSDFYLFTYLFIFWRKYAELTVKISSFFENLRIRANGYHYTPFHLHTSLPVVVNCTELSVRIPMAERMPCTLLVFIHFREGSSSLSISSCWHSSSAISSKPSLDSCCPLLSDSSVASSAVT